tara:strand:- start:208 stop:2124 length:1917 start_codon:yes stop_codon:yes gene_type:complete
MKLKECYFKKLINTQCEIEKCKKYYLETMKLKSIKYIVWTLNNIIDELTPFGIKKIGISTNDDIYFYDKNNFAIAKKNNKFYEYYRNYHTIHSSGINIIDYILKHLNKTEKIQLQNIISQIKYPHYICNYWITNNNIIDLHILSPINGLKHIQIDLISIPKTISLYYKGKNVTLNNINISKQFDINPISIDFDKNDTNIFSTDILYEDLNIDIWRKILGKGLHYHCGDFSYFNDYRAFEQSIINLYPFIGLNKKILDIGCGWGGPATLLRSDLNANITGITPSKQQLLYYEQLGFNVYHGCIETARLYGKWDIGLCVESFTHLNQKVFLKKISKYCDTLIMLVNCSSKYQINKNFKMEILTPYQLKEILIESGWHITYFNNMRKDNKSNHYWNERIPKNIKSIHLNALNIHNINAIKNSNEWCKNNPVILVVAHTTNRKMNIYNNIKSFIGKSDYEYNDLFQKLKLNVKVEDNSECILKNMKEIFSYFNNNCWKIHPYQYGNTKTYGKIFINEHPKCINNIINKYRIKDIEHNYLISFNRFESNNDNEFIKSHYDIFKNQNPIQTSICYLKGSYPYGGEFYIEINNKKIIIPSKTGRIITFTGDLKHGAKPFSNNTSRFMIAYSQFNNSIYENTVKLK